MSRICHLLALLLLCVCTARAEGEATGEGTTLSPSSQQAWEADGWQFRNVNVSHGLPNNLSWRVLALDDRTLFVVCDYSFAIYDGARFRLCPFDFGRRHRAATYSNAASYVDAERRVWIKNYVNLFLFDQRSSRFIYAIDSIFRAVGVRSHVADFFLDADREAWLLTSDGHLYLTDLHRPARHVLSLPQGQGRRLVNVAQAGRECLLLYSDGHVDYYDKRRGRISRSEARFGGTDPYAEYSWTTWGDHAAVVGTSRPQGGLLLYDSNTRRWTRFYKKPYSYTRLLPTPQGGLLAIDPWRLTAFDSRLQLDHEMGQLPTELHSYTNRDLLDATIDWQGGLWISSYRYGLFYTHPQLPHLSRLDVSAQGFDGTYMAASPQGHVFATQDGHIWSLGPSGQQRSELLSLPRTTVSLLGTDAQGRLYVRTHDRFFVLATSPAGGTAATPTDLSHLDGMDGLPHALTALPDGRLFICLGRERAGWFSLADRRFHPCPIPAAFVDRYRDVRFLRYDHEARRVVLGGKFGVYYYDLTTRRYAHFFPHGNDFGGHVLCCNDYLRDSRGNQWFATNAGLFLQPHGTPTDSLTRLTTVHGLLDNCVHAIAEDPQGLLWVTSSTGLTSLQAATPIPTDSITCHRYSLKRLTDGGEFADRCLFFAQNALWAGSTNGIVRMATAGSRTDLPPLRVQLSALAVADEEADADGQWRGHQVADLTHRQLTLPYGIHSLTLYFGACDYLHAGETTFRYWIDHDAPRLRQTEGDLRLDYPSLPSGRYHLYVQVQQPDGTWSEAQAWLLRVPQPWWRTWWALLIYAALAFTAIALGRYVWRRWTWLQAQLHERRHKMMVQANEVKPTELRIKSRDQQFLQQAVADVEQHMADETFSVEQLSADMALTRTGLYRRLQAICGQSPVEFIRTIRMRRAEQLVRESGLNIEEIARQIGFRSTRNFSATFKQAYGQTPTDYRKAAITKEK